VALFDFVRRETPPDAVLIVRRPRALALYTERRASVYHSADDPALLAYFRQVQATHVVVGPFDATPLLPDLVRRHPEEFEPVYEGVEYRVFRPLPDHAHEETGMGGSLCGSSRAWAHRSRSPLLPVYLAALVVALGLPSLEKGASGDDYIHRVWLLGRAHYPQLDPALFRLRPALDVHVTVDGDPRSNARLMDLGVLPWWTASDLPASPARLAHPLARLPLVA
jgi:hypothetical protein